MPSIVGVHGVDTGAGRDLGEEKCVRRPAGPPAARRRPRTRRGASHPGGGRDGRPVIGGDGCPGRGWRPQRGQLGGERAGHEVRGARLGCPGASVVVPGTGSRCGPRPGDPPGP
ncbi:hypothetical protein NKG05_20620 [Oerskovia sp. M15]